MNNEYLFNPSNQRVVKKPSKSTFEGYYSRCSLFAKKVHGVYVITRFMGCDVRDNLDLSHIKKPLVFETAIEQGLNKGNRTYWATYHQASLGHRYFELSHECIEAQNRMNDVRATIGVGYQLTEEHDEASKRMRDAVAAFHGIDQMLEPWLKKMGVYSVDELTRDANYVPISKRLPIVLPIVGYESDSMRFIQL